MAPHDALCAVRAALHVIAAGISICLFAFAEQESPPTFGTTVVVPGGLIGVVYHISPWSRSLPYFQALDPLGVIYTLSLNVPPRDFREGFPGVTDRFEWFAIDYGGRFWIEKPGMYQFALTSDDGSKLYIDDELIIDNDGIHPAQVRSARAALSGGIHHIRVSYFQGPRDQVALILQVALPGEQWRIFSTDEFKPPSNPEAWHYRDAYDASPSGVARVDLRVVPGAASPGDQISVEVVFQSLPGKELFGLAWELVVPAQVLELVDGPETGRSVEDSDKVVNCSLQKSYLYACMLPGDQKPVVSGAIAVFRFKIRSGVQPRTTTLRIEKIEATTVDGRRSPLRDSEATVIVH